MRLLDLTLPTPAENLALDEALLDRAESAEGCETNVLRIWEPEHPFVVIGRASHVRSEVNLEACRADQIRVYRRCSGGAAVVAAPGCLMYAVVLSSRRNQKLRMIELAHRFVLGRIVKGLGSLGLVTQMEGTSDLTLDGRKFSGNSLRCKKAHILYHGTLLYDAPIDSIDNWLLMPPRQPEYRQGRGHRQFIVNLPVTRTQLMRALLNAWKPVGVVGDWPRIKVSQLVQDRYSDEDWNYQR